MAITEPSKDKTKKIGDHGKKHDGGNVGAKKEGERNGDSPKNSSENKFGGVDGTFNEVREFANSTSDGAVVLAEAFIKTKNYEGGKSEGKKAKDNIVAGVDISYRGSWCFDNRITAFGCGRSLVFGQGK